MKKGQALTKAEKRERMKRVVEKLKAVYPKALCSLEYEGDGWKLLVMGRLSAQCTDERVNLVCRELFRQLPTAEAMANAPLEQIEELIKSCGLYKMKAKNIRDASLRLVRDYGGVVPASMEELLKFEGVGRKIANLLLGDLYHLPAIVADTHCMRICGRLGMYKAGEKNPLKTEKIMSELVEPSEQSDLCHRLVLFGREYCKAQGSRCDECPLNTDCSFEGNDGIRFQRLTKDRNGECLDLVWSVFSVFEVPDFPEEGVLEYKRIIEQTKRQENIVFYGATHRGRVVGVMGMREGNHIGYFYVNPQYHRRGIGKRLFALMRKDYCVQEFTVNACPYGVPVYERLGFVKTDTQQNVNGVIFIPMKFKES
ncbi:MAG: GNAT family N-acetyltransferase [Clostridia bacterium]|nr:GNAT family N-acetyltransferase [Clostridia bacterium]